MQTLYTDVRSTSGRNRFLQRLSAALKIRHVSFRKNNTKEDSMNTMLRQQLSHSYRLAGLAAALLLVPVASQASIYSQPAMAIRSTGEVDMVAQGPNNSLIYYWNTGGGWASTTIAGSNTTYSAPAIVVCENYNVDLPLSLAIVVAMGPNHSLKCYTATPGSPWSSTTIGQNYSTYSAPAIANPSNIWGEADVVAQGPNNSLMYYSGWAGGWSSAPIGQNYSTYSAPAIAVRYPSGEADVVAQGPNNSLIYYWNTGGGWSSAPIGQNYSTYSAPAIAVRYPSGEADVVAQGPNHSLRYYYAWPGTKWYSTTIPGNAYSAPAIAVWSSNNEAEVVAQGPNNSLIYYWNYSGNPWYSWTVAGSSTTYSAPSIVIGSYYQGDITTYGPYLAVMGQNSALDYYAPIGNLNWLLTPL